MILDFNSRSNYDFLARIPIFWHESVSLITSNWFTVSILEAVYLNKSKSDTLFITHVAFSGLTNSNVVKKKNIIQSYPRPHLIYLCFLEDEVVKS